MERDDVVVWPDDGMTRDEYLDTLIFEVEKYKEELEARESELIESENELIEVQTIESNEMLNSIDSRLESLNNYTYVLLWSIALVVSVLVFRFIYYKIIKNTFRSLFNTSF